MNPDGWARVREDVALQTPEYKASLEVFERGGDQMVFIHLYVFAPWSRTLLVRMQREWAFLRQHITCTLFARPDNDDAQWEHFIRLFGFKFLTVADFEDGSRRRIFWLPGISHG